MHNGVSWYKEGIAIASNPFPEGYICCQYCKYRIHRSGYETDHCIITNEWLPAPKTQVGHICPMVFDEEEGKNGD